jgi:DNA-binding SARP family transcriptional activator
MAVLETLLPLAKMEGYDDLLIRPTYLGLKDDKAALPMLIEAYSRGVEPIFTEKLLQRKGVLGLCYHPGTTLSVRSLGLFEVWRGNELVGTNDWRREKARQLFQLFLTYRGKWMQREQIVDLLWPELDAEAAIRDFKVALNALNRALEPARPRGAAPFFIARHEHLYTLNPVAEMVVDVDQFEALSASDDVPGLRQALDLYVGDFLPDSLYSDWSMEMRSRLSRMVLETAERLAQKLLQAGEVEELVEVCELILYRDRFWEEAYRLMMQGYASKHNRSQLMHTYRRCELVLRDGLGIEPARETQALYEKLMGNL